MEDFMLLMCKYDGFSFVVKFHRSLTFADLMSTLSTSTGVLDVDSFCVYYSVGGHPKVVIRNDEDLENLFCLRDALSFKYVDVFVEVEGPVSESNVASQHREYVGHDNCMGTTSITASEAASQSSSSQVTLLSSSWSQALSCCGQIFEKGMDQFREALCKFSVEKGFLFDYEKNNKKKVKAVCALKAATGCSWVVVASHSTVSGSVYVKRFVNEHTCGAVSVDKGAKRLSHTVIASLIVDLIKTKPGLAAKDVVDHFKSNYGLEIHYKKAWRAIEKARSTMFGDETVSFSVLQRYLSVASNNNPGSHFVLDLEADTKKFRRLFCSFSACIDGFKYCRPILCLDGTFLKGRFKGILLSAIGKDGNQGIFPLAFAVVDSETTDNWKWFLVELSKILDDSRVINFISDRNLGLLEAMPAVFPSSCHFYCLQHLKNNLRDKFSQKFHSASFREHVVHLFTECAQEHNESLCLSKIMALREIGGAIADKFLNELPVHQWTSAFARGCRYGDMTSNAAESFNSWINDIRDLPITQMVDNLRAKLMKMWAERRDTSKSWNGVLCPFMLQKVDDFVQQGRTWLVKKSSDSVYEVSSSPSAVVDISHKTCTCYAWQQNGFPCVHACVAICRSSLPIHTVVEECFYVGNYCRSYEGIIYPILTSYLLDNSCGIDVGILPPSTKRQPGRPRKKRFKSKGEFVRGVRCGRCGKLGNHNRKTCKENLV